MTKQKKDNKEKESIIRSNKNDNKPISDFNELKSIKYYNKWLEIKKLINFNQKVKIVYFINSLKTIIWRKSKIFYFEGNKALCIIFWNKNNTLFS